MIETAVTKLKQPSRHESQAMAAIVINFCHESQAMAAIVINFCVKFYLDKGV